jgi:cytochrome c biogenesis protein CcmG/thiol:disulfide interchange protein DsbE
MTFRQSLYLLPVLLFGALAAYFIAALQPGYDPRALPSVMIDKPAPAFNLAGLSGAGLGGEGLALAGFKGKPMVINFFASWCVPCREEHPLLMRLAEKEHIPLYGIDYKDRPQDATRLLVQFGNPYRAVGIDQDGRTGLDFGVYGVPETYVIDGTGHIRKKFTGPMTAQQVEQELLPLLKQLGGT